MPLVELFTGFNVSSSGLRAMRLRQNLISSNIANAETTRTTEGGPYRRQTAVLKADPAEVQPKFVLAEPSMVGRMTHGRHMAIPSSLFAESSDRFGSGVMVEQVIKDDSPPRLVHDPTHPDANADGYVAYPNISVVQEMVDLIAVTRAYEANTAALQSTKAMIQKALEI